MFRRQRDIEAEDDISVESELENIYSKSATSDGYLYERHKILKPIG